MVYSKTMIFTTDGEEDFIVDDDYSVAQVYNGIRERKTIIGRWDITDSPLCEVMFNPDSVMAVGRRIEQDD